MQFTVNVNVEPGPAAAATLDSILTAVKALQLQGTHLMSAISDFAAKQAAFNQDVSNDLDAIQANITNLNALITQLQNSAGTISPEDQATLDTLQTAGTDLQTKADALAGKTPPAVPVVAPDAPQATVVTP